jgi:hypothetical protein
MKTLLAIILFIYLIIWSCLFIDTNDVIQFGHKGDFATKRIFILKLRNAGIYDQIDLMYII